MKTNSFENPTVVSPDQWLAARRELLREEKEFTKFRDRLAARRRELPWVKVDKPYVFASPTGPVTLADLFEGRRQLIVYHFMFGPGWEEGCKSCSYVADHIAPAVVHLQARDVAFAAISHAPLEEFAPFKQRMGWGFNWVSSHGNDFNRDYHVSFTAEELARGKVYYNYGLTNFPVEEAPGLSVFAKDANGNVFHTYSTYSRGLDSLIGTYNLLDLVPKGRDENTEYTMNWVRYHDRSINPPMPSRRAEVSRRAVRWLGPAALLAVTPKCLLCVLGYVGLGAALGHGGPEICGAPSDAPAAWASLLAWFGLAGGLGAFGFLASCRRLRSAGAAKSNA